MWVFPSQLGSGGKKARNPVEVTLETNLQKKVASEGLVAKMLARQVGRRSSMIASVTQCNFVRGANPETTVLSIDGVGA